MVRHWISGPKQTQEMRTRNNVMYQMRQDGKTYREISERFGVSRNRVLQCVERIQRKNDD